MTGVFSAALPEVVSAGFRSRPAQVRTGIFPDRKWSQGPFPAETCVFDDVIVAEAAVVVLELVGATFGVLLLDAEVVVVVDADAGVEVERSSLEIFFGLEVGKRIFVGVVAARFRFERQLKNISTN